MHAKPTLSQPRGLTVSLAAAFSAIVAVGSLSAVAWLFQREGMPFEQLVAAERACAAHEYASARESCVNDWLEAARTRRLARK